MEFMDFNSDQTDEKDWKQSQVSKDGRTYM